MSTPFPTAREFAEVLGLAVTEEWIAGFDMARELALMRAPMAETRYCGLNAS